MTLAVPGRAASARSDNIRGIVGMLAAMAVFVLNDTLMKLAAAHFPTGEAIFLRGVFTVGFCLALICASNLSWALPQRGLAKGAALRSVMDIGGTVLFLVALVHMPLGDIFGILQFTPLAITAAAALFLGAKVGWRRWLAATVGLIGVLIIVRPGRQRVQPLRGPGARLRAVLRGARSRHPRRCPARAVAGDRRIVGDHGHAGEPGLHCRSRPGAGPAPGRR